VILVAGAGYVVPLVGDLMRMPGLPVSPQAERRDLVDGAFVHTTGAAGSTSVAPA
jgi:formyltetrahydrofolate synthetase